MNDKPRIDSVLFQLTEEQQAQVYDWLHSLGYERTREKLAQPPPEGFGIRTYDPSLRRFFVRYCAAIHRDDPLDDVAPADSPHGLQAAEKAAHLSAFELATDPANPDSFAKATRWIGRQKSHDLKLRYLKIAEDQLALAKQRLALDREKMELNASRMALKNMLKLQEIYRTPNLDDEDKIRAARLHLFGSAPD